MSAANVPNAGWKSTSGALLIYEHDLDQVKDVLCTLLAECQARCALLICRRDGALIWQQGDIGSLDTTSLAALAAAGFAATKEIASLIGEPEFSVLFHQGKSEHLHLNLISDDVLMMLLFDDRTTIGLVRVLARDASQQLTGILDTTTNNSNPG